MKTKNPHGCAVQSGSVEGIVNANIMRFFQVRYKYKGDNQWWYADVAIGEHEEDIIKACKWSLFERFGFVSSMEIVKEYEFATQ